MAIIPQSNQPTNQPHSADDDELLDLLLADEGFTAEQPPAIPRRRTTGPAPLSFAQQRFWFLDQLEPENAAYNIPTAVIHLHGPLDVAALERSLLEIIRRHESLRTIFVVIEGEPRQQINEPAPALHQLDLRSLPKPERRVEADRLAAEAARRPFALAEGPLFRTALHQLADDEYRLLITMHHIIADGWSLGVLYRELATLYSSFTADQPSPLVELPLQYADFAAWQSQRVHSDAWQKQLDYWRTQLADAPPSLLLPTDHPRPAQPGYHPAGLLKFQLPPALSQQIIELSRQNGCTLFMTLLTAFQILIFRYSRQTDICVGSLIANRNLGALENLIGYFVNTQVHRADLSGNPTFAALLQQVKQTALAAFDHQDVPFEKLLETFQPERDLSLTPYFQAMFVLQNAPLPPPEMAGLQMTVSEVESGLAQFDLVLEMAETPAGLAGLIRYDALLFEAATLERMLGHWQTLLSGIVANPDCPIAKLPLLTAVERHQLLIAWNHTERDFPLADCFQQRFEAQAEKTPEAIAVSCNETQLTYRQLNAQANRLAHLFMAQGVGPEVLVALLAERSIDFLTTILAVFKAGGAYLPLDPLHPPRRQRQILQQSRAPLVLASTEFLPALDEALADVLPAERPQVHPIETLLAQPASAENPPSRATPANLAYVIFTSGSTGRPKGAMVTHVGMLNHLWSKVEDLNLTAADVLAQNASQTFDISVWQFLAPLLVGGQVRIFQNEIAHDPGRLLNEVAHRRITIFQLVPSLLRAIMQATMADAPPPNLTALRWVVPTGEALTTELARQWLALYPGIPLLNAYGSTECSDDQCHHPLYEVAPDFHLPTIPIGKAMANVQLYILDEALSPVPIGVPGELYVGGIGVGRGYLHDAERTAAAFIDNPFLKDEGERRKAEEKAGFILQPSSSCLYKTGDLGRYLPDGSIEFLGRVDFMVKIRGFRIELGEIEAVLNRNPAVQEAVVVVRSPQHTPDDKYLAAYVVPKTGHSPTSIDLRAYLKEHLPDYMIPSAMMLLAALPLNRNGKIDRRALPEPEFSPAAATAADPPTTPTEIALAQIWADLLGVEQVSRHDDFFDLGGHSLLAAQVFLRAKEAFQVDIPMYQLFRYPTVAGLAAIIDTALSEKSR